MRLSLFVPAYNAGRRLAEVVNRVPASLAGEILSIWIINDGSGDDTGAVARKLMTADSRIHVHSFEGNRGYGEAVKKGLVLCTKDGCDAALCLHGDGQYPPEEIPRLCRAMEDGNLDIVQGSRIASGTALSGGMPLYKYTANRVLTFFENIVFGLRLTDYHSGMLLYSARALAAIDFNRLSSSFDFDLEVIASARRAGLAIGEVPIPTRYAGETSHLNPLTYGLRVVRVIINYFAGGYRQ